MFSINYVIEALADLAPRDKVMAAFAEADVEGLNYILLNFKVLKMKFIYGANVILYYLPGQEVIPWIRFEVLLSSDVPARDFMTKMYSKLLEFGLEVVVKYDGISIMKKVKSGDIKGELMRFLYNVIKIVEDIKLPEEEIRKKLVFSGYAVLHYG